MGSHLIPLSAKIQQEWEAERGQPCSLSKAEMNQLPIPSLLGRISGLGLGFKVKCMLFL